MSVQAQDERCREIRIQMDAYLDRDLPDDSRQTLLAHLEQCPACSGELAVRQSLRAQLTKAVRSVEQPAFLEARVRARLRQPQRIPFWKLSLAASAAALLIAICGAGVAYQRGHFRLTPQAEESYIASISSRVGVLMRVGLGDHVDCAVFRRYPKNPPALEQMAAEIGQQYAGLIPIVRQHAPGDFRLIMAHQCNYHDRQFIHLVLRNNARLLSVILTRKRAGEDLSAQQLGPLGAQQLGPLGAQQLGSLSAQQRGPLSAQQLGPVLGETSTPIYASSVQRFQITAFETHDYLVYIVSDAPQQRNMALMQAMAPSLRAYLSKLES